MESLFEAMHKYPTETGIAMLVILFVCITIENIFKK